MIRLMMIVSGSFCLALVTTIKAWATAGVALLTVVSGTMTPAMEPFSEIPADTRLSLAKDGSIQFLHYAACEEVTVHGGQVVLTQSGFSVEGGQVDRRPLPCRHESVAQESGGRLSVTVWESGSVLLRGLPSGQIPDHVTLPAKSVFVLIGDRASTFSSVRLIQDGKVLAEVPVEAKRAEWPEDVLKEDTTYELCFLSRNPQSSVVRINVRIIPAATDERQEALVMIDFETAASSTPSK